MQHLHTLNILHQVYFGIIRKFDWKSAKKKQVKITVFL